MLFRVELYQVQHVQHLSLQLDLSANQLTCIVGKNGVGKTTLIRAFRNLSHADTFLRTAARDIFQPDSSICYEIAGQSFRFSYDSAIHSLNCRTPIPKDIRELCAVELP